MSLNDVFGPMPGRPDHHDFAVLCEIVLQLDGRSYDPGFDYAAFLAERVDPDSVRYMAEQRALRMLVKLGRNPEHNTKLLAALGSMWLDAFNVGHIFHERGTTTDQT